MEKTNFAETDVKTTMLAKNGMLYVSRVQDVEPYLKANAEEMAAAPTWRRGNRKDRPLRKIADIPNVIVEQWLKEGVNIFSNDPDQVRRVRRKLDDYTNRKLKTHPGRIGIRRSQRF